MWVYGSGFQKSLDVSKAIDKAAGAEREVIGHTKAGASSLERKRRVEQGYRPALTNCKPESIEITAPTTEAAKLWQGWGTALKPAWEPIIVARKPFKGTVAANVLEHGCGALNIDGCRLQAADAPAGRTRHGGGIVGAGSSYELPDSHGEMPAGRWPANLIHDGSEEVVGLFPQTAPSSDRPRKNSAAAHNNTASMGKSSGDWITRGHNDHGGSAARFFYCAKASKADRSEGNNHPTVKPHDLMRYLCRLVTPPGGTVLDPFCGSGSTGKAAVREGFGFIGIEREAEYARIARCRIQAALG